MVLMKLITIKELPAWYEANPYVIEGYRPPMSLLNTFRTLFQWHNETLNIYTHLLPGLYFLACVLFTAPECSGPCQTLWYAGYWAATAMGLNSAIGHTFYSSGPQYNQLAWRFDFIGVIAINSMHLVSDTFIVCSILLNSIELYYAVVSLELVWILFVLYRVCAGPFQVAQEWSFLLPFLTCVPLTIPLYAYVRVYVENPHIHSIVQSSLNCTLCILVAGIVFLKGRLPERLYRYRYRLLDYASSHVWHHLFCVGAVLSAFRIFPLIEYYQSTV
jgi:adiponectin receptor